MNKIIGLIKKYKKNIMYYLLGFFILALSVNILKTANLGSGPWDSVYINLYTLLNKVKGYSWVSLGMLNFAVSFTFMIVVLSYRRKLSYIFMIIPIIGVSIFIDFWNVLIFKDRISNELIYQILFFISGILLLPLGLSLLVKSKFTAYVFDELMLMFVKITNASKITYVRLVIEISGILTGILIGYFSNYLYDGTFGVVKFGSLILTIAISPVMTIYFKILKIDHTK